MSRPFVNLPLKLTNPDGSILDVIGWGDQYYARFETHDGFSVVRDPETGFFHYAARSDAGRLIPTRVRATMGRGRPEGIAEHLREDSNVVRAQVLASPLMNARQRWRERRASRRAALRASAAEHAAPPPQGTIGNYVGLCLLIQFPDVPATVSAEEVTRFCNEEGYSNFGNNGSVYDYFLQSSMGRLRYKNQITAYYTARNPRSYYTDPSVTYGARAQELIREALDSLLAGGSDFSQLSRDSGGFIYALNVFYAGPTANNWAEGLWPHSSGIYPNYELADGSRFCDYQITNTGYELSLGTFCHENGHMLCDFPDLYDYGYESVGDGNYCLMAYGGSDFNPVNVGAYLKHAAGWASNVSTLSPGIRVCLSAERNDFVIHRKPGTPTEYYIIENRQQSGRDASLPDSGLAIWHVDELGTNNNEQGSATEHYECALMQADGRRLRADLWSDGHIHPSATTNVTRDVYQTPGHTGADTLVGVGGSRQTRSFTIEPPCACGQDREFDIAALVTEAQRANDNVELGVSPDALSGMLQQGIVPDVLACGRFLVNGLSLPGGVLRALTGRLALFIAGDLTLQGDFASDLAAEAELDVFVSGDLTVQGSAQIGMPEHPSAVRLYIAGSGAIELSDRVKVAAQLYAPHAPVNVATPVLGTVVSYGSVAAASVDVAAFFTLHYDRAVAELGERCDGAPPPRCDSCEQCPFGLACVDGACAACRTDADCCDPFGCTDGKCQPLIYTAPMQ